MPAAAGPGEQIVWSGQGAPNTYPEPRARRLLVSSEVASLSAPGREPRGQPGVVEPVRAAVAARVAALPVAAPPTPEPSTAVSATPPTRVPRATSFSREPTSSVVPQNFDAELRLINAAKGPTRCRAAAPWQRFGSTSTHRRRQSIGAGGNSGSPRRPSSKRTASCKLRDAHRRARPLAQKPNLSFGSAGAARVIRLVALGATCTNKWATSRVCNCWKSSRAVRTIARYVNFLESTTFGTWLSNVRSVTG